jgi:glycosyltransferase involved in cell wall biosynthesis
MTKPKLIRITTVPLSLDKLLTGQLHFMNSYYDVIAISSEKEYLNKIGFKENVRTFHLEMSRKITPIRDFIAVIKLFLFLRKEKPCIVHTHTPKAGIIGMLASKLAGVPQRFHTVAGMPLLETTGFKRKILDFVEKLTYACATKVYPNSQGLTDIILANNFCKAAKLKVLANGSSNGIDTAYFNPELFNESQNAILRKQLYIEPNDFVFVFVGRLVADKGINELVNAFETLQPFDPSTLRPFDPLTLRPFDKLRAGLVQGRRSSGQAKLRAGEAQGDHSETNCKLLLVGDYEVDLDPLAPETLVIIQNNKDIVSVGFQTDVRPYFAISDALVFPSYREGFPNVVMQAGAMGLPSIVTNINGCNEIIVEGENGIIIPVKNSKAILESMKSMIFNPTTLQMKEKTRAMIVNRYEQRLVWEALLEEYSLASSVLSE